MVSTESDSESNDEVKNCYFNKDIFHSDGKNQVEINQDDQQNYCHESFSQKMTDMF